MSGPEPGKYWIQLAGDPKPYIGVEPGPGVKPVVTAARNNIVSALVFVQCQPRLHYLFNSHFSFFT
jgi:hypothetical protein